MNLAKEELSTAEWWRNQRHRYDLGLVIASSSSFFIFSSMFYIFDFPIKVNFSIEPIINQGIFYLPAIGLANILYFLGPLSETIFKPADYEYYRKVIFNFGLWLSISFTFLVPGYIFFLVYGFRSFD